MSTKVEKLERGLEEVVKSFTTFQNIAMQADNLPSKIALDLARTALDVSSIVRNARSEDTLQGEVPYHTQTKDLLNAQNPVEQLGHGNIWLAGPENSSMTKTDLSPMLAHQQESSSFIHESMPVPEGVFSTTYMPLVPTAPEPEPNTTSWFAKQIPLLCLERGLKLLAASNMTYDELHPALSIHLAAVTPQDLLRSMINALGGVRISPEKPVGLPDMYRLVEGATDLLVDRPAMLAPQQLEHGWTRTKISTDVWDFQGEWLEPIDVQEYLEWKGIFLGNSDPGKVLRIVLPESTLAATWEQDAAAVFIETIQSSRLLSDARSTIHDFKDFSFGMLAQRNVPSSYWPRTNRSFHMNAPRQSMADEQFKQSHNQGEVVHKTWSAATTYSTENIETFVNVVLDLDRLLRFLVEAAVCIGPGPGIRKEAVEHALRVSLVIS